MEVNQSRAFDNNSVGQILNLLPSDKRNSILRLDKYYQKNEYILKKSQQKTEHIKKIKSLNSNSRVRLEVSLKKRF